VHLAELRDACVDGRPRAPVDAAGIQHALEHARVVDLPRGHEHLDQLQTLRGVP
jgi:hypothetical protein